MSEMFTLLPTLSNHGVIPRAAQMAQNGPKKPRQDRNDLPKEVRLDQGRKGIAIIHIACDTRVVKGDAVSENIKLVGIT